MKDDQPAISLPRLSRGVLARAGVSVVQYPVRMMQVGEGRFIRGFVDWMVHRANAAGMVRSSVVVVQPRPGGHVAELAAQDGLFTVVTRGVTEDGRTVDGREVVSSVATCVDPHRDPGAFLLAACSPDLRFVASNTTEAGIVFEPAPLERSSIPVTFPAKITRLLFERYERLRGTAAPGLVFLPCELIENNGRALRECVVRTAQHWDLPADFIRWVEDRNVFCNTLVDRIVTGRPEGADATALDTAAGYTDPLMCVTEPYYAWVIEAPPEIADELPLHRAGLNVTWTHDVAPYRERKVRILNGAHTLIALAAFLAGHDTVRQAIEDPVFAGLLDRTLADEILPGLDLPRAETEAFARATLARFRNPYVRHQLLDISLNSVSKWSARLLPTLLAHVRRTGEPPRGVGFSLAALIAFYRGTPDTAGQSLRGQRPAGDTYAIRDSGPVLSAMAAAWAAAPRDPASVVARVMSDRTLWPAELTGQPGLADLVTLHLGNILTHGARTAGEMVCTDLSNARPRSIS